jgi:two-component system, OmpR family, sensor histidine kinase VicK
MARTDHPRHRTTTPSSLAIDRHTTPDTAADAGAAAARRPGARGVGRLLPRQLGWRVKGATALVLCLTVALLAVWAIRAQTAQAREGIDTLAASLARNLALSSVNPLLTEQFDVVEELLLRAVELPKVTDIRVLDRQGATIAHAAHEAGQSARAVYDESIPVQLPGATLPLRREDVDAQTMYAWHPITAGTALGWVRVAIDIRSLQTMQQQIVQGTVLAAVLAALCAVTVLAGVLRRPLQAIRSARDFAIGLARNDGQQLEVMEGPTETMALAHALNDTSLRLQAQRLAIDHAMAELRLREAALADSNEQLGTIFALSPDGLVGIDAVGFIRYANPAFFQLLSLQHKEFVGQPVSALDRHLRERHADPAHYAGLQACFRDGAPTPTAAEQAPAAPAKSDTAADVAPGGPRLAAKDTPTLITLARPRHQVLALVSRHTQCQTSARLLYLRDVTHETEVDRMKSEFLSTAAHELRTPMTSIQGCVELMRLREFDAAKRARLLDIAHRQSVVMSRIVDELLDLARIEAGGSADFDFELHALGDLVERTCADFVPPNGRDGPVPLWTPQSAQGPGAPAWVRVDAAKTAQVLRNLLSNAYKYSQAGPVELTLIEESDSVGTVFTGFAVTDHGMGMTDEQVARVFERFYRADTSGQVSGTGLGMSIVKEIVTLMGGQVSVRSAPGRGTTVSVCLPRAAAPTGHVDAGEGSKILPPVAVDAALT